MKSHKVALIAILLWAATIAVFAWFFIRGNTVASGDDRTAIVLGASERDMILSEMRKLLGGVQGVLDGINHGDMKQTASAARAVGMASAVDVNPALMAKLPMPFKQLGMSVHHEMDNLAQAAENGKSAAELQSMLADTLSKCIACHTSWQLKADN